MFFLDAFQNRIVVNAILFVYHIGPGKHGGNTVYLYTVYGSRYCSNVNRILFCVLKGWTSTAYCSGSLLTALSKQWVFYCFVKDCAIVSNIQTVSVHAWYSLYLPLSFSRCIVWSDISWNATTSLVGCKCFCLNVILDNYYRHKMCIMISIWRFFVGTEN